MKRLLGRWRAPLAHRLRSLGDEGLYSILSNTQAVDLEARHGNRMYAGLRLACAPETSDSRGLNRHLTGDLCPLAASRSTPHLMTMHLMTMHPICCPPSFSIPNSVFGPEEFASASTRTQRRQVCTRRRKAANVSPPTSQEAPRQVERIVDDLH